MKSLPLGSQRPRLAAQPGEDLPVIADPFRKRKQSRRDARNTYTTLQKRRGRHRRSDAGLYRETSQRTTGYL